MAVNKKTFKLWFTDTGKSVEIEGSEEREKGENKRDR